MIKHSTKVGCLILYPIRAKRCAVAGVVLRPLHTTLLFAPAHVGVADTPRYCEANEKYFKRRKKETSSVAHAIEHENF